MTETRTFGQWLKQRRKTLDITQEELAQRVNCAVVTIYKIEANARRPSKQIAELLAQHLGIPPPDHEAFVVFARTATPPAVMPWGTPFHPPNNLPTSPTPLIGRAKDIAAVTKRLLHEDTQLLTLIGPPGIGKTRLSLAVAGEVLDEFADGVFLVWLASINDSESVLDAIVQTLGLQEAGPQSPLERLKQYLSDRQMLLVLDNFEQVLAAAPHIAKLLAVCPFVKIVVTSRAALRIRRERQFPVPTLALPDLNGLPAAEDVRSIAAVELFVERAQAVQPDFAVTNENAQSVAALCHRLDGLPLAIELISARIKLLPPVALLERLRGSLMLHSDGLRDLEPRHRTLNAAIGWSFDLLDSHERSLFSRLGVFAGGCTLEAVEIVCQPEISALDGMASLLDKSLVQQQTSMGGEPRFTILETIREYALERLAESGESQQIRHRHARFYVKLAKTPPSGLPSAMSHADWLDRIESDYDNLRLALEWCVDHDLATGTRMILAICGYWIQRGRLAEAHIWTGAYLEAYRHADIDTWKTLREILNCAGVAAYFRADLASMCDHAQALLALGEAQQDKTSMAYAFFYFGQEALQREDFERARHMFEEGLVFSRQGENDEHTASTLLMLGLVAKGQKDYAQALAFNAESLAVYRQRGNRWLESVVLVNGADIWAAQGDYREARVLCRQSLAISLELGDRRSVSQTFEQLAELIGLEGNIQRAARLMGAAEGLRASILAPIEPLFRPDHERYLTRIRMNLDEATFTAAWAEGRLMPLEEAIEYALSEE